MYSIRSLALLVVSLTFLATPRPSEAAQPPQYNRRLHAALFELREARIEVRNARGDFGGHRNQALRAIDDAIASLKLMLRIKGDDIRGLDRNPEFYRRHKNSPRLRQALEDLRNARDELRGNLEFGGLCDRALRDINHAIDQIQLLLRHAR